MLLGPGWAETIVPFQILSLGVYFRAGYRLTASIILATGHVFSLSACQAVYGLLIVGGALVGAQWGIAGIAIATLLALLVFYLLLYALSARVSGAPLSSFLAVHLRPALLFLIILATAFVGRTSLLGFDAPPIAVLIRSVALGIAVVAAATRFLGPRLWGELLYRQGLELVGRYTAKEQGEGRDADDSHD